MRHVMVLHDVGSSVATALLKISPDILSKKNKNPYKQKKFKPPNNSAIHA